MHSLQISFTTAGGWIRELAVYLVPAPARIIYQTRGLLLVGLKSGVCVRQGQCLEHVAWWPAREYVRQKARTGTSRT